MEVVLKKPERDLNRAAYIYLKKQRADIEKKLVTAFNWWAEDDWTHCYVDKTYEGKADITDESTWEEMAKFHMVWSKKFYEVFVPLLKEWKAGK